MLVLPTTLTLLLLASSWPAATQAQDSEIVWVWNQRCPKPTTVALRVRLDGKDIYSTLLPICRWERRFEDGTASFRFTAARPLIWYGYRSDEGDGTEDPGEKTAAGTPFEVDFWQAGGETDAIVLGYSVAATDAIHMNSLHQLSPSRKMITTIAPGLVLETWPEKRP